MDDESASLDRSPPHSHEAEEHVIACCLMDGSDTLTRCSAFNVTAETFYIPSNRLIFQALRKIHGDGREVSIEVLAEELKAARQLEAIGGWQYLMEVTGKIPTTTHAGYFIEKIREKYLLRELIKAATGAVEQSYGFTGDYGEFFEEIRTTFGRIADGATADDLTARPLTSYGVPPDNDPSNLLGNRYLCRGDGGLLISSSGMGKSSMSLQMGALWALGRSAFGIQCAKPLKQVIVQAEDSDGDIGEVWASICHELKLTDEEKAQIERNVIVIEERVCRGQTFLGKVRSLVRKHKPDVFWINPLMAYVDGDTTKAEVMGRFLREGLNGINAKKEFAYMIVHHTPKPPSAPDQAKPKPKKWSEVMYDGAGSADLTNWARAIMVLKATDNEGEFDLILAKRGKRAGTVVEVEHGIGKRWEPTTVIALKHSTGSFEVKGRKKPLSSVFWLPREVAKEEPEEEQQEAPARSNIEAEDDALRAYPASDEDPEPYAAIQRRMKIDIGSCSPKAFDEYRRGLIKRKLIELTDDGYRRTLSGDVAVNGL